MSLTISRNFEDRFYHNGANCISDRYKPLPHPSHKLRFLDLQLELLEDFRIRVVQVKDNTHNPLGERFCAIMNTAYYITEVLREWSELIVSWVVYVNVGPELSANIS